MASKVTLVAWCRGKALQHVISVHVLQGTGTACGQLAARGNVHKPTLTPYLQAAFGGHGFVIGKPGAAQVQGCTVTCTRCAAQVGMPAQVPPPLAARVARQQTATKPANKPVAARKPAKAARVRASK